MDDSNTHTKKEPESEGAYLYRYAGIQEREGRIPLWLLLVVVSLIIWSVYYTVRYWSDG